MEILRLVLCTMLTYLSKEEISSGLRRLGNLWPVFLRSGEEKKNKSCRSLSSFCELALLYYIVILSLPNLCVNKRDMIMKTLLQGKSSA